jgi:acetamidase/formamidase/ketosteroid isomerase-like protein
MRTHIRLLAGISFAGVTLLASRAGAELPLVLHIKDYATAPMTGVTTGAGNLGSLARINMLREEPGGAARFFVNDLNGPLYILDKSTKTFVTYLDFNGRGDRRGLFDKLPFEQGYANGFIAFQFDPDYRRNGTFYTIHLEEPAAPGSTMPDGASVPGLKLAGYTTTPPIKTPGTIEREAVVIAWTDTNIRNTTFEGTARELMRVELNTRIHPMGDLIFNSDARPGDADWRVLYISCGDGGSGERRTAMRQNPQRLDTMVGKILRIVPDLALHTITSTVSENGRYRIPNDNPFTSTPGARTEIWAYGLRNPHRMTWDVDPRNRTNNRLLASSIGLHAWETVYVIRKGANYGYPEREGTERLQGPDNVMGPLPAVDEIPVRISDTVTHGTVVPTYPVIAYPHNAGGGDAITGGFVYRGKALPALKGKFVFGDISTGKVWYADYNEMLKADDGNPATLAAMHEVKLRWEAPRNAPDAGAGPSVFPSAFPVVLAAYKSRGGMDPDLPGTGAVSGSGRADIRFAVDAAGELYLLSKVDGMIRSVVAAAPAAPAPAPTTHRLEATPATVAYGYYWSEAKPALRIASGDIIDADTLLTNTPTGLARAGVADDRIQASLKSIVAEVTGDRRGPGGHILTGPVYVDGAMPGDVLEVKVLSIDFPIDYGYNGCSGFIPENCDRSAALRIIPIDRKTMTAEYAPGIVIPLRPFFGSMGVAPAPEIGRVSSNPPGKHAGNLDNRELVAGSTLYIPVFVPGALFEVGDGHAAQGDGEVDQTAIETSLRGRLQLTVRKDMKLTWPRAETATDYISMATDPDLAIATKVAIQEMVDFVAATRKLTKHQAYQVVSIAGNVAMTQLVDKPNLGVHVRMPKIIFSATGTVSSAEQEIRAAERLWNESRARADVAALDRLLADEWTVTHGDGTVDSKKQYLDDLRTGVRRFFGDVKQDDFTVRVNGDTAVAAGVSDSKVEYQGKPSGGALRFTRVYQKRDGRWQMIVSHATRR